ncbi:MAG TPA: type I DNA topoisomerase [Clostridia bacterium]|nr:type I DNA topoisomerase [Clostridia bacterium]
MTKTLVVVESPAKAKTIARYLGKEYDVRASVGHFRDLPAGTLGVDVKNDFRPMYLTMPGKEKIVGELRAAADKADQILLATDPDREGEAIAWHLAHILDMDEQSTSRIAFNEITAKAVHDAVNKPSPINTNLVNAQQARRILDRLVGYELSPFLWKKIKKGLSAGRVQSVATRLIVLREREIDAFIPKEYWKIRAFFSKTKDDPLFAALYHGKKKNGRVSRVTIGSKDELTKLLEELEACDYVVDEVKTGTRKRRPYAPFTTSTLQQSGSRALGFTAKRTMSAAQRLYEGVVLGDLGQTSLVTYIRTDSVRVTAEAVTSARELVEETYGPTYLPPKAPFYRNKSKSQDAHEAIRPSHFDLPPQRVKAYLSSDQYRLYEMIWKRFIASQMVAATYKKGTIDILAGENLFRAQGESLLFPGWLALYGATEADAEEPRKKSSSDDGDDEPELIDLPELAAKDQLLLDRLLPEQKFTQPPPRYTEASLINEMEKLGIGRPSTYAPTISTLFDRFYVEREAKQLKPTELGVTVTVMLEEHFRKIVDTDFTAQMENELDEVESGSRDWVEVLKAFYGPFHEDVIKANENAEKIVIEVVPTGKKCPECKEGDLIFRDGRYGKFIACSRFPECKYTEAISEPTKSHCPKCGSIVRERKIRRGNKLYFCDKAKDPECDFTSFDLPLDDKFCETCGSYMVLKRFRGRTYERCSNKECPSNSRSKKKTADPTDKNEE